MRICVAALLLIALTTPLIWADRKQYIPSDTLRVDLWPVPDFSLTESSGRTVRRDDLKGKVWVAAFFYTCCGGDCKELSNSMAQLQKRLADCPDVYLVSISVHPEQDTPKILRDYGKQLGADPNRWWFLTGDEKTIYQLVQKGFKLHVQRDKDAIKGQDVDHSFHLVLVDQTGLMRGYVDGREPKNVDRLEKRIRQLVAKTAEESDDSSTPTTSAALPLTETPAGPTMWPALNASLNATCALLLLLGYVAIRQRWVTFHKICMLSALAVSVVFLGCYLYYHFAVRNGMPTSFTGEGWVRPLYFGILVSHTILAALVAPLAVLTTYRGLRGTIARHMRLARWTLPIWLYVSITGVVVYWMLYVLFPAH